MFGDPQGVPVERVLPGTPYSRRQVPSAGGRAHRGGRRRAGERNRAEALVVDRLGDGRVLTADRALRVTRDAELAEAHVEGVDGKQAAGERLPDAEAQLDHLRSEEH